MSHSLLAGGEGGCVALVFYVYLNGGMDFVVDYFKGCESYFSHVFSSHNSHCLC